MNTRILFGLLLLTALATMLTSCVSVGEYESENLPWSTPAPWENTTIGIRH